MINEKINKPIITQKECDDYARLAKWCNENNAHLEDKGDYYEVVENVVEEHIPTTEEKIALLKQKLAESDYKCLKFIDGELTEEEYAPIKEERAQLRIEIRKLEEIS